MRLGDEQMPMKKKMKFLIFSTKKKIKKKNDDIFDGRQEQSNGMCSNILISSLWSVIATLMHRRILVSNEDQSFMMQSRCWWELLRSFFPLFGCVRHFPEWAFSLHDDGQSRAAWLGVVCFWCCQEMCAHQSIINAQFSQLKINWFPYKEPKREKNWKQPDIHTYKTGAVHGYCIRSSFTSYIPETGWVFFFVF